VELENSLAAAIDIDNAWCTLLQYLSQYVQTDAGATL
jgi:hypothetical protein